MQDTVDKYLKYDVINDIFLTEETLLQESIDVSKFRKHIKDFKKLFIQIGKIKDKKTAIRFFKKNEKLLSRFVMSFRKSFPVVFSSFDPFEDVDDNVPIQPQTKTENPPVENKEEPPQKIEKPEVQRKIEKPIEEKPVEEITDKDINSPNDALKVSMKKYYQRAKEMIIKLFRKLKKLFKIDTGDEINSGALFDRIYFFIVKSIEASILIALIKVYGPAILAIVAIIGFIFVYLNLIYIKMNNSELSYGEALKQSYKEIYILFKKLFLSFKIYKHEYPIIFLSMIILYFSNLALSVLTIFSIGAFGAMFLCVFLSVIVIYYILLMIDDVSTAEYKK